MSTLGNLVDSDRSCEELGEIEAFIADEGAPTQLSFRVAVMLMKCATEGAIDTAEKSKEIEEDAADFEPYHMYMVAIATREPEVDAEVVTEYETNVLEHLVDLDADSFHRIEQGSEANCVYSEF